MSNEAESASSMSSSCEPVDLSSVSNEKRYCCPHLNCGSTFSFRSNLSRHMRNKHPDQKENVCHVCNKRFNNLSSLSTHVRKCHSGDDHKKTPGIEYKVLPSYEAFSEWKAQEERLSQSSFVQRSGIKRSKTSEILYFYCNRQGVYNPKGCGKRMTKVKGTSKLGKPCTAYIKCTKNTKNDSVLAEYCTVHSHEIQIRHLRITNDLRQIIAAKLDMGLPIDKVLDIVRDSVWNIEGREHLINKQDIRNIGSQYCTDGVQRHTNDAVSVQAWVEELQRSDYNPVLLYKMQGVQNNLFEKDDFVLSIQTKFQFEMLKMFGNATVCIDSTHQTNHYDYPLNTLMVVDEYGEGIPVAYLLCNRESGDIMQDFFGAIKSKVGHLEPEVFMTDDAPQYFHAWQHVFGESSVTKKLLCRWHLDKTWRKAINGKIKETDKKPFVYHHLLVLLSESNVTEFNKKLQSFLSWLNQEDMTEFMLYFQSNYCNRISEWATYGRQHTIVNTNMHVEAFHRLVKTVYFQQKQNRRVDCLLNVLLKLTRDKAFERLQKGEECKVSFRQSEITKRHVNAEKSSSNMKINIISDNNWSVQSQRDNTYNIQKEKLCSCPLKCLHCGVCTHMYSCTCLDNLLHSTACKHIHFLHMWLNKGEQLNAVDQEVKHLADSSVNSSHFELLNIPDKSYESVSEATLNVCQEILQTLPKVSDVSILLSVKKRMQAVLSLLQVNTKPISGKLAMNPAASYSANSNFKKQLNFYKTRQTNSHKITRWTKPSLNEEQDICAKLLSQDITICGICHKEDEPAEEEKEQYNYWTRCSKCDIWIHSNCSIHKDQKDFCLTCEK